jgi:hypothetical protein
MTDRERDEAEPVTVYGKAHGVISAGNPRQDNENKE